MDCRRAPHSRPSCLLYMVDVLLYDTERRSGYADDLCICRIGHTLEENAPLLGQDLR